HASEHERPRPAFEVARKDDQQQRSGKLADIERGQRRTDEIGAAGLAQIAWKESVAAEIDRARPGEDGAEAQDFARRPVGPPSSRGTDGGGFFGWRQRQHQERDDDDRQRPEDECRAPALTEEREEERK